jgi:hypothetical protein
VVGAVEQVRVDLQGDARVRVSEQAATTTTFIRSAIRSEAKP